MTPELLIAVFIALLLSLSGTAGVLLGLGGRHQFPSQRAEYPPACALLHASGALHLMPWLGVAGMLLWILLQCAVSAALVLGQRLLKHRLRHRGRDTHPARLPRVQSFPLPGRTLRSGS